MIVLATVLDVLAVVGVPEVPVLVEAAPVLVKVEPAHFGVEPVPVDFPFDVAVVVPVDLAFVVAVVVDFPFAVFPIAMVDCSFVVDPVVVVFVSAVVDLLGFASFARVDDTGCAPYECLYKRTPRPKLCPKGYVWCGLCSLLGRLKLSSTMLP